MNGFEEKMTKSVFHRNAPFSINIRISFFSEEGYHLHFTFSESSRNGQLFNVICRKRLVSFFHTTSDRIQFKKILSSEHKFEIFFSESL